MNNQLKYPFTQEIWQNNKDGKCYEVFALVIDKSSTGIGELMVVYRIGTNYYVKEINEFMSDFTRVDRPDSMPTMVSSKPLFNTLTKSYWTIGLTLLFLILLIIVIWFVTFYFLV